MLNLVFKKGLTEFNIRIEFFKNTFVDKFVSTLSDNIDKPLDCSALILPQQNHEWDQSKINLLSDNLKLAIEKTVQLTGIAYPLGMDLITFTDKSKKERAVLNYIHRSFTKFYKSGWTSWDGKNSSNSGYTDSKVLIDLLQEINEGVHRLEPYFYKDNPRYKRAQITELQFNFKNSSYKELSESDFQFKSNNYDADIWLPVTCMLGKNILSCYLDYDDPSQFDIVNENLYNGDFVFSNRKNFITPDMLSWLDKHQVTPMYGVPLGKILEGKDILIEIKEAFLNQFAGIQNSFTLERIYLN